MRGEGGGGGGEGGEREREAKTKGTEKGREERGGGGSVWRKIRFSSSVMCSVLDDASVMCKVGGGRRRKTRGKKEE